MKTDILLNLREDYRLQYSFSKLFEIEPMPNGLTLTIAGYDFVARCHLDLDTMLYHILMESDMPSLDNIFLAEHLKRTGWKCDYDRNAETV